MFKPQRSPAKTKIYLCISVEKNVKQLSHIAIVSLKGTVFSALSLSV